MEKGTLAQMAILKFGTLIVAARGTLGGATLSANKAGPYAKTWGKGSNPRTQIQSAHRSSLVRWAIAWRTITQSQRTAWDVYAALPAQDLTNSLGELYSISGFGWYVRINMNLEQATAPARPDPPTLLEPAAPILQTFHLKTDAAATETRMILDASSPNVLDPIVLKATLFFSQGISAGLAHPVHMTTELPTNSAPVFAAGTADASTENAGNPATNMTDGDINTDWLTPFQIVTGWARITLPQAEEIIEYRWYQTVIGPTLLSPEDWTFEYWDGGGWITVDTQIDPPFPQDVYQVFPVPFGNTSTQWRMDITKNRSAQPFLGMAEFDLFKAPSGTRQILFQETIQTRLGVIQLGQRAFVQIQIQNQHGRRGPVATDFADASDA